MKQNSDTAPQALREVWKWKEAIYENVKDLPVPQAVSAILDRAVEARVKLGFPASVLRKDSPGRVAEDHPDYDAGA